MAIALTMASARAFRLRIPLLSIGRRWRIRPVTILVIIIIITILIIILFGGDTGHIFGAVFRRNVHLAINMALDVISNPDPPQIFAGTAHLGSSSSLGRTNQPFLLGKGLPIAD
jgi:hypothetical protein